jgi:thiamine biosynthesis lipoprotein
LKQRSLKFFRYEFKAMGTSCDIQFYAKNSTVAQQIANTVIHDVRRLEAIYSRYRSDSFLSEINRVAAVGGAIEVDNETAGLLHYAATCYQESDGLFDITSGILRRAWSFKENVLPDEQTLHTLLAKVGWEKVDWSAPRLTFLTAGMEIDFGGVVKEYAVDRAAALCQQAGIRHGIINLGGDIKIIGARADGSAWRIGIQHPRRAGEMLTTLNLTEGALASSGDYERCIVLDGVRYSHILNPKTGWPIKHLALVSVVGDFCVVAGSASTIAMLKEAEGAAWLAQLGLPHLWVDVQGNSGCSGIQI